MIIAESKRKSKGKGKKDDRTERVKENNPHVASGRGSNNRVFTYYPIEEIEELEDESSPQENDNAIANRSSNSGCTDRDLGLAQDDLNTHENDDTVE